MRRLLFALFAASWLSWGISAQPSLKDGFEAQYKKLVEDSLHTTTGDPQFWNKAHEIVFGDRVPTTDTATAKAVFQLGLVQTRVQATEAQAIVVPAHSVVVYHGKPFCLEHDVPAPGANAPMWLIPSSALFPQEAQEIAAALLRYAANHSADQNVIQTILWAIRHADKTPLDKLLPAQESVLNSAIPDGASKYYVFIRSLKSRGAGESRSGSVTTGNRESTAIVASTEEETDSGKLLTLDNASGQIAQKNLRNAGIVAHGNLNPYNPADVNGIVAQLRRAESQVGQRRTLETSMEATGIATDGAQLLEGEENAPVSGQQAAQQQTQPGAEHPEDDAYTLINQTVAARVHTTSLTDSTIEIGNSGESPYLFDSSKYVGMARPVSQPTYIVPPPSADTTGTTPPRAAVPTGTRYTIEGVRNSMPLQVGVSTTISGVVMRNGVPVPNLSMAVNDGIGLRCFSLTTDNVGAFRFEEQPGAARAALIEFRIDRNNVFQFAYNILDNGSASSFWVQGISLHNATGNPIKAVVTSSSGATPLTFIVAPNSTAPIIYPQAPSLVFRPTVYAGGTVLVGMVSLSSTVDSSGVVTYSVSGGEGPLSFSVYTTGQNWGGCWVPGLRGGIGAGLAVDGSVCVGTDGISVGGDLTIGAATTGLSIQIVDWSAASPSPGAQAGATIPAHSIAPSSIPIQPPGR